MIGIISLFYLLSAYSYLLFHTITEVFTILVAFAIFIIIWNTRKHSPPSNFFLIIGISSLFVGVLDFFHALSYSGMGIFLDYDANLPTQLWIAARYMQSLSLLLASISFDRKIVTRDAFVAYTTVTTLTLVLIFTGLFPDCYVGSLTAFKIYSEYMIILILILVLFLLYKQKINFKETVYLHLSVAILFTIIAELAFTFYVSVFGFSNFIGHIAKLISFILIYEAIVVTSLHNPFDTLFRNLKSSEESLRHERDQLARSNTIIRDFNKSLNVVNSILRHDLLGNLHSVNLSLEMIKKQKTTETIQFAQLAVNKGVKLILSMQNMEILLSESGSLRKIDICEVIDQIRSENLFQSLQIDVTGPKQCFVDADETLIPVIENLLKNIVTHSGSDKAVIEIKEVGDICELRISDFGVGISDDVKENLFEAGYTSDETGTSIGLGLFIVKSVIDRYKGTVEVQDNDPSGVVFVLKLKLSKE